MTKRITPTERLLRSAVRAFQRGRHWDAGRDMRLAADILGERAFQSAIDRGTDREYAERQRVQATRFLHECALLCDAHGEAVWEGWRVRRGTGRMFDNTMLPFWRSLLIADRDWYEDVEVRWMLEQQKGAA